MVASLTRGLHAVAIVGYDRDGLWIQNSWGTAWGRGGYGHIRYEEWLASASDAWVARMGAPVALSARRQAAGRKAGDGLLAELRTRAITLDAAGQFQDYGDFATTVSSAKAVLVRELDAYTRQLRELALTEHPDRTEPIPRRMALFIGGGVARDMAATTLGRMHDHFRTAHTFPVSLLWNPHALDRLVDLVGRAYRKRVPLGTVVASDDQRADRLDDTLEPTIARLGGQLDWATIKESARRAGTIDGDRRDALHDVADTLFELQAGSTDADPFELHLVSHGTGALLMARLVDVLRARHQDGSPPLVGSLTLLAPANTVDDFKASFVTAHSAGLIGRLTLVTLSDADERDDDVDGMYRKSLLYLVSHVLEDVLRVPTGRDGTPIASMARWVDQDD